MRAQRGRRMPAGLIAGYSGTPLPRKLGIREGATVALIDAPEDFSVTLGALPDGVTLRRGARGKADLVIWFVRTESRLARDISRVSAFMGDGRLWIAWRKKTARTRAARGPTESTVRAAGGPTESTVRAAGIARGLVDFKVCAIDESWSGLLFARRKALR